MLNNELQKEIFDFLMKLQQCGYEHNYTGALNLVNNYEKIPTKYLKNVDIDKEMQRKNNAGVKYAWWDFTLSRHIHNKTFGENRNKNYTMQEQLEYDLRGSIYYIRLLYINGWNDDIYSKFLSMISGIKNQLSKIKTYNYLQIQEREMNKKKE